MIALGVAAFVVVVLELVAGVAIVVVARRFWRQVEPQVRPMLAMFAPAPPPHTPPGGETPDTLTAPMHPSEAGPPNTPPA